MPTQEPFDPKKFEEKMKEEQKEKEITQNAQDVIEEDQASLPKPEEAKEDDYEKEDFEKCYGNFLRYS